MLLNIPYIMSLFLRINSLTNIFLNSWFETNVPREKLLLFQFLYENECFKHVRLKFCDWFSLIFIFGVSNRKIVLWFKMFPKLFYFNQIIVKNIKNCFKMLFYTLHSTLLFKGFLVYTSNVRNFLIHNINEYFIVFDKT